MYVTKNAAYSWQAAVQESVDATLNRTVSSGRAEFVGNICPPWAADLIAGRASSDRLTMHHDRVMSLKLYEFACSISIVQVLCSTVLLGQQSHTTAALLACAIPIVKVAVCLQASAELHTMRAASPTYSAAQLATMWRCPQEATFS